MLLWRANQEWRGVWCGGHGQNPNSLLSGAPGAEVHLAHFTQQSPPMQRNPVLLGNFSSLW